MNIAKVVLIAMLLISKVAIAETKTLNEYVSFLQKSCATHQKFSDSDLKKAGATRLHYSIACGQVNAVRTLVKQKANIESAYVYCDPLHIAIISDQPEIFNILLEAGADPNFAKEDQITPLLIAVINEKYSYISKLKNAGAKVDAPYKDGYTPLQIAATFKDEKAITALLEAGANPNATDNEGMTALHHASKSMALPLPKGLIKKEQLAKVILSNDLAIANLIRGGANVNAVDKNGFTPLHVAVANEQDFALSNLLMAGADPNIQEKIMGATPLTLAVYKCDMVTAKKLISAKANINIQSKNGNSLLHLAVLYNNAEMVDFLLNAGINQSLKNNEGYLALEIAKKKNNRKILTAFKKAGKK